MFFFPKTPEEEETCYWLLSKSLREINALCISCGTSTIELRFFYVSERGVLLFRKFYLKKEEKIVAENRFITIFITNCF